MNKERRVNLGLSGYLKALRLEKGYTLREIEAMIGVSSSYLHRIENAERFCPSVPVLEALARCYGRPPLEIFEVALNMTTGAKAENTDALFETIIYNNDFIINGKIAEKEVKDAIVSMIKLLLNLCPEKDNTYKDIPKILQEVENFKKALSS